MRDEPAFGTMPRLTNGGWNRAPDAAYTRSQCNRIVVPIPTASPFTAAIIGFSTPATAAMKPPGPTSLEIGGGPQRKAATAVPAVQAEPPPGEKPKELRPPPPGAPPPTAHAYDQAPADRRFFFRVHMGLVP